MRLASSVASVVLPAPVGNEREFSIIRKIASTVLLALNKTCKINQAFINNGAQNNKKNFTDHARDRDKNVLCAELLVESEEALLGATRCAGGHHFGFEN